MVMVPNTSSIAPLFGAYVVFTLVSGAAQDFLYTKYAFYHTDALSLCQSLILFVLGALSYVYKSVRAKAAQPAQPPARTGPVPEQQDGPISAQPPPEPVSPHGTPVPMHLQLLLGVSIAGNVLLTNYATEFLSFPIQVIFKSSKLLVAMAVRSLVFKKPNPRIDYYCALLLSAGLIAFMWPSGHKASSGEDDGGNFTLGIICVVGSLISEAVMLNVQEFFLFKRHKVSTEWVMMYGYLYSALSQSILLIAVGKFLETLELLAGPLDPIIRVLLVVFPAFMWVGVTFLLMLIQHHGAVAASAANVIRKIIAVGFSFIYFQRPVTVPITVGTLLVFGSIFWRVYAKAPAPAPKKPVLPVHVVDQNDEERQPLTAASR